MTDQVSVPADTPNYIELAAEIVSAFVSNNSVPVAELPALIGNVHAALRTSAILRRRGRRQSPCLPCRSGGLSPPIT